MALGDVAVLILQLSPLLFTVSLRVFTKQFHNWWISVVDNNDDQADRDRAGNFEMYTLFAFDRFQATFALGGSFLYTGLFVLYTASRPSIRYSDALLLIGGVLLAAGIIVPWKVDGWFKNPDINPTNYCRFFYSDSLHFPSSPSEEVQETIDETYRHPWLAPGKLVLLAEVILLVVVGGLVIGEPFLTN